MPEKKWFVLLIYDVARGDKSAYDFVDGLLADDDFEKPGDPDNTFVMTRAGEEPTRPYSARHCA